MPYDLHGRKIRARRRQFRITRADAEAYLDMLVEAVPETSFYGPSDISRRQMPKMEAYAWRHLEKLPMCVDLFFHDGSWVPEFKERDDGPWYSLANLPSPSVSFHPAPYLRPLEIPELGITIRRCSEGFMDSNDLIGDERGKKLVDKVFRLSQKILSNRVVAVDLATSAVIREERDWNWHGRDVARLCREESDVYVSVMLDRENGRFWGYRPAESMSA